MKRRGLEEKELRELEELYEEYKARAEQAHARSNIKNLTDYEKVNKLLEKIRMSLKPRLERNI